ncbi:hypothetical protein Pelo_5370 [Pelomyxa schiedti]|nr:hypothetical protein Pelo_5370 [Pelomyxa schiedti]
MINCSTAPEELELLLKEPSQISCHFRERMFSTRTLQFSVPGHPHTLQFKHASTDWYCDVCFAEFSSGDSSFSCDMCQYDMCGDCFSAVISYHPRHPHPLEQLNSSCGWRCDVCTTYSPGGFRYHCKQGCDWDVCSKCLMHPSTSVKEGPKNPQLRIQQLEERVKSLNSKLSAEIEELEAKLNFCNAELEKERTMAAKLNEEVEAFKKGREKEYMKEKSELEAKFREELKASRMECEKLRAEHAREKIMFKTRQDDEMKAAKKQWEQITRALNQQHLEELNQMKKKLQQLQEQLQKQEEEHTSIALITAFPELNEAFKLASILQAQLKTSAPEFILLQKSLERLTRNLQGASKNNEELASHLRALTELKGTLKKQVIKSDATCKKILGQTLTVQSSEAEIQECSRNISLLTRMWGMKGLTDKKNSIDVPTAECPDTPPKPLTVPLQAHYDEPCTPPFQVLCTLTDTLAQLQSCRFDECTKLADKHTVLSKELSEQKTLGCTLHKAIEESQRECAELQREHQSKWKLLRGLEGDERFIGMPEVWSMLSELLPQAQQAILDLVVSKASSGRFSTNNSNCNKSPTAGTLPGCTASPAVAPENTPLVCSVSSSDMMQMMCIECDERPPNMQFQPCGHVVLCSQCGATVRKCPHCRVPIKTKIHIFP